jgi:hypothetical protein
MLVDHKETILKRLPCAAISRFSDEDLVAEIKGAIQIRPAGSGNSIYSTLCNAKIRGTLMC